MGTKILVEPSVEPVTLEEARRHLGVIPYSITDGHPNDPLIQSLISASRSWCEAFTGLSLAVRTYELALDVWPADNEIELPMSPVFAIESVTFVDPEEVVQTMSPLDYLLDMHQRPGWLLPAVGVTWPATLAVINAIRIRALAGFSDVPDSDFPDSPFLPPAIKSAILLLVGEYYNNRENTLSGRTEPMSIGVASLLRPFRVNLGMA